MWDKRFFDKLLELDGDIGGKKILKENVDSLKIVPEQTGEYGWESQLPRIYVVGRRE